MSEECTICKDIYSEDKPPFELECNHIFCKYCILDTFKRDNRCPLCRREYEIIIQPKISENQNIDLPDFIRTAIHRLPTNSTQNIINSIELLSYRIYVRIQRVINIIYNPSYEIIINDHSKIIFSIHGIVVLFLTMLLWLILYNVYRP